MTTANNYARALAMLKTPIRAAEEAAQQLRSAPVLLKILENPMVPFPEKEAVIGRLFPKEVQNLMKCLCRKGQVHLAPAIFAAYLPYANSLSGILKAELLYVSKPTETQLEGIRQYLLRRFGVSSAELQLTECPALIGGFVLRAGDVELDWSIRGRLARLGKQLQAEVRG